MSDLHIEADGPDANWGRALAYHPLLAHFFGSVNAGVFFGQLAYWQPRADNPLGVYKTAEEWTDETGLTYREQVTARKSLVAAGFVTETHKRLEHRLFFRIEWSTFNPAFKAWVMQRGGSFAPAPKVKFPNDENAIRDSQGQRAPNDENAIREQTKAQSGDCGNRNPLISTETTSESTAESTAHTSGDPAAPVPAGVRQEPPKVQMPPYQAPAPQDATDPQKVVGTLPLLGGKSHDVKRVDLLLWVQAYPAVDVKLALRQMKAWLVANETQQKTKRGINKFITNWLAKEQNRGGGSAPRQPKADHYSAPMGRGARHGQAAPPPEVHAQAPVVQKLR